MPGQGQPWPGGAPQYGYSTPGQPGAQPYYYQAPRPAPTGPRGEPLAEFTDRLLARLIDGAVLGAAMLVIEIPVVIAFITMMAGQIDSTDPGADPELWGGQGSTILVFLGLYFVVMLVIVAAVYVYEVELMFRTGQTLGKRAMKIRVVSLDGLPMDRGIAAKRWLAANVASMVIPMYSWIDGLWQLWDQPLRQCLHDKYARTIVVKDVPAPAWPTGGPA